MKNKRFFSNNFLKKNRKASHVGVVVSFVIFITFLMFLYTLLEPTATREKDKQYLIDYAELSLIGSATGNFTSIIIDVTESSGDKDCINIQNIDEEVIPDEVRDKLIIKNSSGNNFNYEIQGEGLEIETGEDFTGILKIYYSDDVEGSQTSLGGCDPKPHAVGTIKTYEQIFESKLESLKNSYEADYEEMKINIGIPDGTEFNFYLLNSEREIILTAKNQEPPETVSVYVEEIPIQYMDDEGNINLGFLVIEVW